MGFNYCTYDWILRLMGSGHLGTHPPAGLPRCSNLQGHLCVLTCPCLLIFTQCQVSHRRETMKPLASLKTAAWDLTPGYVVPQSWG